VYEECHIMLVVRLLGNGHGSAWVKIYVKAIFSPFWIWMNYIVQAISLKLWYCIYSKKIDFSIFFLLAWMCYDSWMLMNGMLRELAVVAFIRSVMILLVRFCNFLLMKMQCTCINVNFNWDACQCQAVECHLMCNAVPEDTAVVYMFALRGNIIKRSVDIFAITCLCQVYVRYCMLRVTGVKRWLHTTRPIAHATYISVGHACCYLQLNIPIVFHCSLSSNSQYSWKQVTTNRQHQLAHLYLLKSWCMLR
jgi:hypothetical protein